MTGLTPVPTPASPRIDQLLIDAKIAAPPPRSGLISREPLTGPARVSGCRLVSVTAPAGYGKSTLLAEWASVDERAVAWVSLDRFDDDPVALLTVIAAAFSRAMRGDESLVDDMRVHPAAVLGRAAPRLAFALAHASAPFVLFIDDLHVLAAPACEDVLGVIAAGVPAGSQVVMASRSMPPVVPIARAAGNVVEIGARDLALGSDGAREIFRAAKVPLTVEQLDVVTARTEGWPVGLHLAASIARVAHDSAAVIHGDDRFVADYLYRESFAAIPVVVQRFLRRIAVLDHMSDSLCQSVAGPPPAGATLKDLESSNVFLVPEDRTREWYHFHPLYREFLLGELRREEEQQIPALHLRAAEWYEASNVPSLAIEHLLQAPDHARAALLVDALGLATYQSGGLATLMRWLAALGDQAIADYPPLGVLCGWIAALSGHAAEADHWRARLAAVQFAEQPADGTASFDSAWAMLRAAMCADGPTRMMEDVLSALAQEPGWSVWRDQALQLAGEAHLLAGEESEADRYFAQASARGSEVGNVDTQILSDAQRAILAMTHGRWDDAADLTRLAVASAEDHRLEDYSTALLAFAAAARLALHKGDRHEAERSLARAMRGRSIATHAIPTVSVRLRVHLAATYWALGDASTARHLVREIDDILIERPALGALLGEVSTLRELVTESSSAVPFPTPLTPAELRLLPYLQTHLTLPEIGTRLFISRNTVRTEVSSIYRKLGVSSRAEGVERATALGLLGA